MAKITNTVRGKMDKPTNAGTLDQILRNDGNGGSVWGEPATQQEIGDAVTDWLEENVPTGTTVVIDKSLSIDSAAADAKKTGDKLSDLKSAITYFETPNSYGFEAGLIKPNNGGNIDSSTRLRSSTNRISGKNIIGFNIKSGYKCVLYVYSVGESVANTYLGYYYNGECSKASSIPSDAWLTGKIFIPFKDKFYRIVLGREDDAAITVEEASNLLVISYTDTTLNISGVPADAKSTSDAVNNVKTEAGSKEDITSRFTFADGYRINAIDGNNLGKSQTSTVGSVSGYVDIEGFEYILLAMPYYKESAAGASGLVFFSSMSQSDAISGSGTICPFDPALEESTYLIKLIEVPEGAKYIRTTWWATDQTQYSEISFSCYGITEGELQYEIDEINTCIEQINDSIANIGSSDNLPDYYFDNKYLDGRVDNIIDAISENSMKGDAFFWFTDPHYFAYIAPSVHNGLNGPMLINYITEHTNIRKVFCGGDLVGGNGMTKRTCLNNFKLVRKHLNPVWHNLYMIVGNHEWNNPNASQPNYQLSMNIIYEMFIKDKENEIQGADELGDYYIDNHVQKIRYLFLGCEYNALIATDRVTWVASQLMDVPSGYTVVVLTHVGLNGSGEINSAFEPVADVLDAANAQSTVTVNGITYNYSGFAGEVACILCGHNHKDMDNQTTGGIPVISTTCDMGKDGNSSAEFNAAREYGTVNEQAIEVVLIDTENKVVKMFRIGGSWDGSAALENPDRTFSW